MKKGSNILFIISAGPQFGLGHYRRMNAVAKAYRDREKLVNINFYCIGCTSEDMTLMDSHLVDSHFFYDDLDNLKNILVENNFDVLIIDLHPAHIVDKIYFLNSLSGSKKTLIVAIDHAAISQSLNADFRFVPSFFKNPTWPKQFTIEYGWDTYLLHKKYETIHPPQKNRLLVLTGGSDVAGLGNIWPQMIARTIYRPIEIHWVQGPFSKSPKLPSQSIHEFFVHVHQSSLDDLLNQCDWVLTVHGVSVFEAVMYKRPCITFNPYSHLDIAEMKALQDSGAVYVASEIEDITFFLEKLISCQIPDQMITLLNRPLIDGRGPLRLVEKIESLRNTIFSA